MARYFRFHTLACLTRQGAEELAATMPAGDDSRALRVVANRIERIMPVEFEAPAREKLEKWLNAKRMHYRPMPRVEAVFTGQWYLSR